MLATRSSEYARSDVQDSSDHLLKVATTSQALMIMALACIITEMKHWK